MIRASSFGGCVRALVLQEMGHPALAPPPRIQQVFDAGHTAEDECVARLLADGHTITDRQLEVEFAGITGHIDGIIGDHLLEIKSFSAAEYAKWWEQGWDMGGLMDRYKWQVSVYMHALGLPLRLVGWNRDTKEYHPRVNHLPFHTQAAIRARKAEIDRWVEMGEAPECDQSMYPCPVVYLHLPDEKDADPLVEELGEQYRAQTALLEAQKQAVSLVRDALEQALGTRDTVDTEHIRVHRYVQRGQRRANRLALVADGLWEKYSVLGEDSTRLRVTLREVDDEKPE